MIVYIAGAISKDFNFMSKFNKKAKELREMGHVVLNPAILPPGLKSQDDYLHICFAMIDVSDVVYFLSDWKESSGAKKEYEYAKKEEKCIAFESED